MKERFNRELGYIVNCIVREEGGDAGSGKSDESLERSMACLAASLESGSRTATPATGSRQETLVGFGYVAAAVCLREMQLQNVATSRLVHIHDYDQDDDDGVQVPYVRV
jgi:hypothetical protein